MLFIGLLGIGSLQAQTPQELQSWLPQIAGWTISGEPEVFGPDNLYNRINGAAPLFLENNFKEMTSFVYTQGEDYITIQAYRHATPVDAFGMYASERSSDLTFFPIGGEAQGDQMGLYCFAGAMYLKIEANNESETIGETIRTIADSLCRKIDPNADYPALFASFPTEYRVPHSESYSASNYLGHEFLKSVYTCDYEFFGNRVQGFLIDAGNAENAKLMLKRYLELTKQQNLLAGKRFVIKDRYNGTILCMRSGQYIAGVFSEDGAYPDENMLFDYIEDYLENLE